MNLFLKDFNTSKEHMTMVVGDLVRWVYIGDIGFLLDIDEEVCLVYCPINMRIFVAYLRDLEVIHGGR